MRGGQVYPGSMSSSNGTMNQMRFGPLILARSLGAGRPHIYLLAHATDVHLAAQVPDVHLVAHAFTQPAREG